MKKLPFYIFIFLLATAISQSVFYYPVMPDPMASHFWFSGKANGWMSKDSFFLFEAVLLVIMILSFIVVPRALEKFKVKKSINIPNKDYWLVPERVDYFYDYFRQSFLWLGVATLILLVGTFQLTFAANLQPVPVLNNSRFLIVFIVYIVFVVIWLISYYRKFNRIK